MRRLKGSFLLLSNLPFFPPSFKPSVLSSWVKSSQSLFLPLLMITSWRLRTIKVSFLFLLRVSLFSSLPRSCLSFSLTLSLSPFFHLLTGSVFLKHTQHQINLSILSSSLLPNSFYSSISSLSVYFALSLFQSPGDWHPLFTGRLLPLLLFLFSLSRSSSIWCLSLFFFIFFFLPGRNTEDNNNVSFLLLFPHQ